MFLVYFELDHNKVNSCTQEVLIGENAFRKVVTEHKETCQGT